MKNKKNLILITILIIGILSFFGFKKYAKKVKDEHCLITQISSKIFDFNTFELNVDSTLNLSDFKVVNKNSGKTIFTNGKSRKGIENDYGYRMFILYYKEIKIYEFGHFLKNNWITNDYKLSLTKKNNQIEPELEISWKHSYINDYFYKRYEYFKNGKLEKITYLSDKKEIYNVENITE